MSVSFIIVLAGYAVTLFLIAYFGRRSMGIPTLALAAGAVLAKLWTDSLTPLIASSGIMVVRPPLSSIVAIVLTLLPALIVLIRAHRVKGMHHGILSSLIFSILAVMLTYGAFANAVVLDDASRVYVVQMLQWDKVIITSCVVLALGEVVFIKHPRPYERHKK